MVSRLCKLALGIGLVLLIPIQAGAQETLERIQNDVAAIVKATRGAVVSIEDERLFIKVDGVDVGETVAQALREAEKELQRTTRKADSASESSAKSEEARKAKAAAAKHLSELREHMSNLREQVHQNMKYNFNVTDAPKSGTGFCIGDNMIVTTADVLEGMKSPVVVLDDMTRIKATVVGMDPESNIGLLKLPAAANVQALKWGNSNSVQIGHFAISIGNQSGQVNSVSLALVAGLRTDGTFSGNHFYPCLIQIAGTVGAGSSGAPLINPRGEIIAMLAGVPAGDWSELQFPGMKGFLPTPPGRKIGSGGTRRIAGATIKTVQATPDEESDEDQQPALTFVRPPVTSAGFAIPVNMVRETVEKLKSGNPIRHAWIGITPEDIVEVKEEGPISKPIRMVRIKDVYADSPACKAGLREGDILISLNGKQVNGADEVRSTSAMLKPGEVLRVVVRRGNDNKTFDLNIEKRPEKIIPKKSREDKEEKKSERAETQGFQRAVIHSGEGPRPNIK